MKVLLKITPIAVKGAILSREDVSRVQGGPRMEDDKRERRAQEC
jgi:hypothetical protein